MRKRFDISSSSDSIKSASIAQIGSKVINVVVQLGITMVLARILTPVEYGTVAVLTVFSSLFSVFADAGISTAIAQSQDLDQHDYERLFFLSLLMGIVLSFGFFLLSFGIAWFYGDSIYVPLGAVMSLAVMFNALSMVPNGILIKERKFKLIAVRLVVCTVVVGAIAIVLAILGFGCYAIVLNTILTALFVLVWNLGGSHLRISVGDVRSVFRKVGSFSIFNLGNGIIGWFAANADSLIVGKLFGAEGLGYYNKAYNLYSYPLSILTNPIVDTILPFLAPLQFDKTALRYRFISVFRKVSFLSALCMAWMNVCATEIILIMYGDNWAPAIPMLAVLAFAVYSRGVNGAFSALLNAAGRPDLLMRSTAINTAVTLGMIFLGGALGFVQSLATCVAIAYNIEMTIPIYFCARYCLDMRPLKLFVHFLPDLGSGILVIVLASVIPWGLSNLFLSFFVKALYVLVGMVAIKVLVDKFVYHEHVDLKKDIVGLFRRP